MTAWMKKANGVAYKTAAYKKSEHCHKNSCICLKCKKFHATLQNLPSIKVSFFLVPIQSWKYSLERLKYAKICTWANNFWEERTFEPVWHHNFRFSFALNHWFKPLILKAPNNNTKLILKIIKLFRKYLHRLWTPLNKHFFPGALVRTAFEAFF